MKRGRKTLPETERKHRLSSSLPFDVVEKVETYHNKEGVDKSEIVKTALNNLFAALPKTYWEARV